MKTLREQRKRGTDDFPFTIYRCRKETAGICTAPPHYHNDMEILQPLEGCIQLAVGNEVLDAVPGQFYFINPEEVHALYTHASPAEYRCLIFGRELLRLPAEHRVMTQLIDPIFEGRLIFPRKIEDPRLLPIIKEISRLQEQNCGEGLIVSDLFRLLALMEPHLLPNVINPIDDPLRRAIDFMELHFSEKVTVPEIAMVAGFNSQYFCSYFKNHTRSTPIEYLTALRMRRAKELLRRTDLSVLEIANQSGFENVSFFIQKFKTATGQTPGQYRKGK